MIGKRKLASTSSPRSPIAALPGAATRKDRRRGRPRRDLRDPHQRHRRHPGRRRRNQRLPDLKYVERDFRITKADDLEAIHHYLAGRVRGHVLICMLACYLTWHLRQALAGLTFTDQHIPAPADPVAPAQRSGQAKAKDAAKRNPGKLPVSSYQDLPGHLSTLTRTITFSGQKIENSHPHPRPATRLRTAPPSRSPSRSHSTRHARHPPCGIFPGPQDPGNLKIT